MKLMVMLGLVIVFLLYLMVGMGCGLPGKLFSTLTVKRYPANIQNSMVPLRSSRLKTGNISLVTTSGVQAALFNTTLYPSTNSCNIASVISSQADSKP
jgi:hypothetical protein